MIMWCETACFTSVRNVPVRTSRGNFFNSVWYFVLPLYALIPCDGVLDTVPLVDNFVFWSTRRAFLISTTSPKKWRKSAPIIGLFTAATMNDQLNVRRSPRSNEIIFSSYVLIVEPFAANNEKFLLILLWRLWDAFAGQTEKSAPVSIKKTCFVFLSTINRRCERKSLPATASTAEFVSFPSAI